MKTLFVLIAIIGIGVVGFTVWKYTVTPTPQISPRPAVPTVTEAPQAATQTPETPSLGAAGLGIVAFGTAAENAVSTLTTLFGKPTKDTGWIDSFSAYGTCPGEKIRVVEWGRLRTFFGDTTYGTKAFFHYEYTARDTTLTTPTLSTDKGVTLGTTTTALKAAYPTVTIEEQGGGDWSTFALAEDSKTTSYFGGNIQNNKIYWIDGGIACGE